MRAYFGEGASGRRLALGVGAIVLLLIVDAVLVFFALRAHDAPQGPPSAAPAPPAAASDRPVPATPSSEPELDEPSGASASASRLLAVAGGGVAWRASMGECGAPGVLEVTVDAGATWSAAGLQIDGPVFALQPNADGARGLAVVGDAQCDPVVHRTFTAAVGWEVSPEQLAGSYLGPAGDVVIAGVEVEAPCESAAAVTGSGGGVVLCGDVAHARTGDGAWVPVAERVIALGPVDRGAAVAMRDVDGCAGITVGIVSGGALLTSCTDIPADAEVAVAAEEGAVWVWAGDAVTVINL